MNIVFIYLIYLKPLKIQIKYQILYSTNYTKTFNSHRIMELYRRKKPHTVHPIILIYYGLKNKFY